MCYIRYLTKILSLKVTRIMNGLEYNIITEWGRDAYVLTSGDTLFEQVPPRVQQLWDDFYLAQQLPNNMKILEFDRILTDFQSNNWSTK